MGLFKPTASSKAGEAAKAERGKRYINPEGAPRRKRDRRAEESLEDPTIVEARIALGDTYSGFKRR